MTAISTPPPPTMAWLYQAVQSRHVCHQNPYSLFRFLHCVLYLHLPVPLAYLQGGLRIHFLGRPMYKSEGLRFCWWTLFLSICFFTIAWLLTAAERPSIKSLSTFGRWWSLIRPPDMACRKALSVTDKLFFFFLTITWLSAAAESRPFGRIVKLDSFPQTSHSRLP